jgi:hypothetical protein
MLLNLGRYTKETTLNDKNIGQFYFYQKSASVGEMILYEGRDIGVEFVVLSEAIDIPGPPKGEGE